MNAVSNNQDNRTRVASHQITKNSEENEMKATQKQNGNKLQLVYQEILKVKGEIEMKVTNHINDVTTWLSKGITSKTPAKVLAGLAVGALMLTATAVPMGTIHADGSDTSPVNNAAATERMMIDPFDNVLLMNDPFGDLDKEGVVSHPAVIEDESWHGWLLDGIFDNDLLGSYPSSSARPADPLTFRDGIFDNDLLDLDEVGVVYATATGRMMNDPFGDLDGEGVVSHPAVIEDESWHGWLLAGFTPNQQVVILGEMDDIGVDDSGFYQSVLIPGADPALAGFTPTQQVVILGEMDDIGVDDSGSYQPFLIPGADPFLAGFTPTQQVVILGEMDDI